jgi:hypothetical protein
MAGKADKMAVIKLVTAEIVINLPVRMYYV